MGLARGVWCQSEGTINAAVLPSASSLRDRPSPVGWRSLTMAKALRKGGKKKRGNEGPLRKERCAATPSKQSLLGSGLVAKRKAKTHKGRRLLAARESQSFAAVKNLLLLRGGRCNSTLQGLLGDLRDLKKPQAVFLSQRKQKDLHPFEDAEPIEYLTRKNGCGLFAFASSSKKRPSRLILGRVYDHEVLDMFEYSVTHYTPASAFSSVQAPRAGSAPLLLLQGGVWEATEELKNAKNLFGDLFRGAASPPDGPPQKLFLSGVDRLIAVSALQTSAAPTSVAAATARSESGEQTSAPETATEASVPGPAASPGVLICIRHYRVVLLRQDAGKAAGGPVVKLEEVGPQIDLKLDRVRLSSAEKWRAATKSHEKAKAEEKKAKQKAAEEEGTAQGPPPKKRSKNITTNAMGDSIGRVFVEKPDFARLKQIQSPLLHKLQREEANRKKAQKRAGGEPALGAK